MPARVFHVGYDENLLRVREMILQQRGFVVQSVMGNSETRNFLADVGPGEETPCDCFVIGWCCSYEEKTSIVEWLKHKWPTIPIVAMDERFVSIPKADVTATHATPEEWIQVVEAATKNQMTGQAAVT